MNSKVYLSLILAAASILPTFGAENLIPENLSIQQANIFHAFNWKFKDIQEELPRIAAAGFGAVQTSPVQGNCASGAEWFYAYMPYDLAFTDAHANGVGKREDLRNLCQEAEKYGIKIIVDVVANHMNKTKSRRAAFWNEEGHERNKGAVNYNSRQSVITGNLGDYYDVVSEHPEVIERMKNFLEDLKSLGVKGIRWDAAKHIGLPSEDCDFFKAASEVEGLWQYGEILDNPGTSADTEYKIAREYAQYIGLTDAQLCTRAINSFKNSNMPSYPTELTASEKRDGRGIPAERLVYWGESHDTYANTGGNTKRTSQGKINHCYVYGACRKGETALWFSRPEETDYSKIKMGRKGSVDALENATIAAVNKFRIAMGDSEQAMDYKMGQAGWFVCTRQAGGAMLMGPAPKVCDLEVSNAGGYMPQGEYRDVISGNIFTVTADKITGTTGESGVAVLSTVEIAGVERIGETLEEAYGEKRYYTLGGMEVAEENLQPGLYICRQGRKTGKILVKN